MRLSQQKAFLAAAATLLLSSLPLSEGAPVSRQEVVHINNSTLPNADDLEQLNIARRDAAYDIAADWIRHTLGSVSDLNPGKNVVGFFDEKSTYCVRNADIAHYFMDGHPFVSGTMTVIVFDDGVFDHAGPGGYNHWGTIGKFVRCEKHLEYYTQENNLPGRAECHNRVYQPGWTNDPDGCTREWNLARCQDHETCVRTEDNDDKIILDPNDPNYPTDDWGLIPGHPGGRPPSG